MRTAVGIDLGTTYSVVACLAPGDPRPRVVPDDAGRTLTPSVVAVVDGRVVVGEEAKERQDAGDEVAAFFKRAMGEPDYLARLGNRTYNTIELSAHVLAHLRAFATRHVGETVDQAVITVPAYFTNPRREATIEAGRHAGVEVLSIISEPTAAARAFGLRAGSPGAVLVYDLGGGTFDVSLVRITETELRVIGTGGDHNLGGKDWDDRLVLWAAEQFHRDTGEQVLETVRDDLFVEAERVKRALSARERAPFTVRSGAALRHYEVTRTLFEDLTRDLVLRTRMLTDHVLAEASVRWSDLTGVVPVGGSTRLPMIRALLAEMSGREPLGDVQPDEAVALGAALRAADELTARAPAAPRMFLRDRRAVVDVMSHSLGMIAISADETRYVNSILVAKNVPIPAENTRRYTLSGRGSADQQLEVLLTQGETDDPMRCEYLGRYVFTGFAAGAARDIDVDVTYGYDRNGVVAVQAFSQPDGGRLDLRIEPLPPDVPARFAGAPPKFEPLTVYLAFDVSGSMRGKPLEEARRAANAFVRECALGPTMVGIVAVSDRTEVLLEASDSTKQIERAIGRLDVGMTGGGNAGHPFDELQRLLKSRTGRRYAIVMADGVWNDQRGAIKRARACHTAGIDVIGVGFGAADRDFLRAISSAGEGVFTDLHGLTGAFSSIARELGSAAATTRLRGRQ